MSQHKLFAVYFDHNRCQILGSINRNRNPFDPMIDHQIITTSIVSKDTVSFLKGTLNDTNHCEVIIYQELSKILNKTIPTKCIG